MSVSNYWLATLKRMSTYEEKKEKKCAQLRKDSENNAEQHSYDGIETWYCSAHFCHKFNWDRRDY